MHHNKWTVLSCVILLVVSISSLQQTELSWAVTTGEEFVYLLSVDEEYGELNVMIEQLPPINQTPTALSDILPIEASASFSNGSSWIAYHDILQFLYSWAFPVGDWYLMSTLIENYNNSYEFLDAADTGYQWRYNFIYHPSFANESFSLDIIYQKEDGMLFSYEMRVTEGANEELIHEYRIEQIIHYPEVRYQFYLYLGISLVCLALVIYLARKYL